MLQKFTTIIALLHLAFFVANGQRSSAVTSKKEKSSIAAIPMINYNRTQGVIIGALVSKYYKLDKKDTISPSSTTGFFGMYTAQKSYAAFAFSRFYFSKDRWRVMAAVGATDINFQFYLEDPAASTGNFYDYSTKAKLVVLQVQRNIFRRLYFGPTASFIKTTTTFGFPDVSGKGFGKHQQSQQYRLHHHQRYKRSCSISYSRNVREF
jgi:hypothetical protein